MTDSNRDWWTVASSADGRKLIACVEMAGYLYTSMDSGATWTPRMTDTTRDWCGVASSADGTRLAACASSDRVYTSSDSGVTWTAREGSRAWRGVASSADGTRLAACVIMGHIYTYNANEQPPIPQTTTGTSGAITGGADAALELQYIGNDTWRPLSHEGALGAE